MINRDTFVLLWGRPRRRQGHSGADVSRTVGGPASTRPGPRGAEAWALPGLSGAERKPGPSSPELGVNWPAPLTRGSHEPAGADVVTARRPAEGGCHAQERTHEDGAQTLPGPGLRLGSKSPIFFSHKRGSDGRTHRWAGPLYGHSRGYGLGPSRTPGTPEALCVKDHVILPTRPRTRPCEPQWTHVDTRGHRGSELRLLAEVGQLSRGSDRAAEASALSATSSCPRAPPPGWRLRVGRTRGRFVRSEQRRLRPGAQCVSKQPRRGGGQGRVALLTRVRRGLSWAPRPGPPVPLGDAATRMQPAPRTPPRL